jgi:hypothetical protein
MLGLNPDRCWLGFFFFFFFQTRLKIAAANSGHVNVYETLLKEAFARIGERRKEFMEVSMRNFSSMQGKPENLI